MKHELELWLETHREQLICYPRHYLLIGMKTGIIEAAPSYQELMDKLVKISPETLTDEELAQKTYIVSTIVMSKKPSQLLN